MAVAFVRSHGAEFVKAAGTTDTYATTALVPAGNLLVMTLVHDNAASANTPTVSSISKPASETAAWLPLGQSTYPNAATAGAYANGAMYAIKTTVDWPSATSLTVTYSTSTVMKAQRLFEFSGADATLRCGVTGGTEYYSTTTTAAYLATAGTTPVVGDLAVGFIFGSNVAAAQAGSNSTTDGAWSAPIGVGSTGGSAATNNYGVFQWKVLNSTSHITHQNSAAMTAGNGVRIAILQATPDPVVSQAAYRFYEDGTESGSTALAAQDTGATADLAAGDVNLGLRVRLQEGNVGNVPATDDFALQWEKNASGTWLDASPSSSILFDTYDSTNYSITQSLGTGTSRSYQAGQQILGTGNPVTRVGFYLQKSGTPDGVVSANIQGSSAGFGVAGAEPTGALTYSDTVFLSTNLSTTLGWHYFEFEQPFTLTDGTAYFLCVETTNTVTAGVRVGGDSTGVHGGVANVLIDGFWEPYSGDFLYQAYTTPSVAPYASPNLTNGAATTNRLTGGTGTFTPGKVSTDGLVDDLGWPVVAITEQYDESNAAVYTTLASPSSPAYGQSFVGNGQKLVRAGFHLRASNVGNGTMTAELYAHTGTFGSDGVPTGSPLATSNNINVSTLTTTAAWYEFSFSGTLVLTAGTPYFIVLRTTNTQSVGIAAGYDTTTPTHPGNSAFDYTGTPSWVSQTSDLIFRLYTTAGIGGHTEVLYSLTLKAADLADADTLRFRVLRNGAVLDTYGVTPTITASKVSGPPAYTATPALTGSGSLSTVRTLDVVTTATLSGSGSLSASTTPHAVAVATLTGGGALTATGEVAAPPENYSTTATLSGAGGLAALVVPKPAHTTTLSGGGALTATVTPKAAAPAILSGGGTLSTAAAPRPAATATLTGSGTLTAPVVPKPAIAASLSGSGSLGVLAAAGATATVTLSGSGTLTATGSATEVGTAAPALTGAGTLATTVVPKFTAAATLTGSGTLAAGAAPKPALAPALTGSGQLAATGTAAEQGSASPALSSVGTLSTVVVPRPAVVPSLTGSGSLGTTAVPRPATVATLSGGGALGAGVVAKPVVGAALTGSGTLGAVGATSGGTTTALSGNGTLTATVAPKFTTTATLSGAGALGVGTTPKAASAPVLTGSGILSTTVTPKATVNPALTGGGTLVAVGATSGGTTVALTGSGALAAGTLPKHTASPVLGGAGALTTDARLTQTLPVTLSGTGTLSTTISQGASATAALSGTGSLTRTGTPRPTAAPPLGGGGSLTAVSSGEAITAVTLTGTGSLTATAFVSSATVGLSGGGALTAQALLATSAPATLAGLGALTARGFIGAAGLPADDPKVNLPGTDNRVLVMSGGGSVTVDPKPRGVVPAHPYAGSVRVHPAGGTVSVEDR